MKQSKDAIKQRRKAYAELHPELVREQGRRKSAKWRTLHLEAERERARKYYALHKERIREQRALHLELARERARRASAKWHVLHSEVAKEKSRRRVAQTSNRVDYQTILLRDGMQCYLCGQPITSMADLHFDHVVPLSKDGLHTEENIRPTHARCNLSKGSKILCAVGGAGE